MNPFRTPRRRMCALAAALVVTASSLALGMRPAAASYVPVSGAGSTWSQNAVDQWRRDVNQYGIQINYAGTGSSDGRRQFLNGTVDFAASDIPFQFKPEDGSAPEQAQAGSYAYMPVTAGGTVFMYNLKIGNTRVTNIRLSGENVTKIFTGVLKTWNDPAIAADNPGLALPAKKIVPVVRSDGSGSTAQFTAWMINQHPDLWNAYCKATGRAPACGQTSYYPTQSSGAFVAQSGDLGVAGYVAQNYADGAIGYVNYSYALNAQFPVAKVLNSAGYYTEPSPNNVAVSLLKADINRDAGSPDYLTQKLEGVYADTDPRTYVLSAYSYMILPTKVGGKFTTDKGSTLSAFAYYAMCEGQQESASLGYSPMPLNLVQASFDQIKKIPGAAVQDVSTEKCHNPTFDAASGKNLLAENAPQPQACDKQGPTQCATGTGGAKAATPVKAGAAGTATGATGTGAGTGGTSNGATSGTGTGGAGSGTGPGGATTSGTGGGSSADGLGGAASCAADDASCTASDGGSGQGGAGGGSSAAAAPLTLSSTSSTSTAGFAVVACVLLAALVLAPGIVIAATKRRSA